MQKSKTHFEVIPIESVKKILEQQQKEKQEREKGLAEKKESGNGT